MAFCGLASAWAKLAFLLLLPAIAIHCAGLATPYWMKVTTVSSRVNVTVGLWKQVNCSGEIGAPCYGEPLAAVYKTNLLTVTRTLECMAIVPAFLAIVLSVYYVTSPTVRTQRVTVWIMTSSFLAMALNVGGAVAWIFNVPSKHFVFWSMGLSLSGAALFMICGILMVRDFRMFDYKRLYAQKAGKKGKKPLADN
ncbi:uncharacterized protein LOC127845539 [Dreissena polymorpha]|uniref:Uncharacterized protein n=1 Tax=Dreissena polymorpha TaxID=45954 RepID=A0A9D4EEN0_DREPO|nr:uncharacterized protein LOC127845539 [Dreissena polymorpha]KAH3776732.1 hypothetical protein DPMN_178165 [Dreissena polymorpha]